MSNSYYNSTYSNPGAGAQDGGGSNAYNYNYGQQQPQQPEQQANQQQQQQPAYGGNAAYGNPNQWQQPQQQPQQQQSSMMQPQQQPDNTNQQPSFWNPATAATMAAMAGSMAQNGMSNPDAMLHLASSAGQNFFKSSSARMIPGFESFMISLRGYFAVDNNYVLRKMQRICFPFLAKSWKRLVRNRVLLSCFRSAIFLVVYYVFLPCTISNRIFLSTAT
jgi:hypothetical protein